MDSFEQQINDLLNTVKGTKDSLYNLINQNINKVSEKDQKFIKDSLKEINTESFDFNSFNKKIQDYADRSRNKES